MRAWASDEGDERHERDEAAQPVEDEDGSQAMIRSVGWAAVLAAIATMSGQAFAGGDPAAGKAKSATCSACHGPSGISTNDEWPSIAGQKQAYMVTQLKAFRDGTRKDPIMGPPAKPLSDQDIQDLAAYFSRLNPVRAVY